MYEIFQKLMDERGIKPYRVSKDTGIASATLTDWKLGRSTPKADKIQKIADYFGVDVSIFYGQTKKDVNSVQNKVFGIVNLPLYGSICCGNGGFVDDNIIEYISLPDSILNPNKEYFAQYAKGDSMIEANINDGDLLIFEKCQHLENGQIGCLCIDENEAVCKKYYYDQSTGIITLQACNHNYSPIVIALENVCFKVLGRLTGVYSKR